MRRAYSHDKCRDGLHPSPLAHGHVSASLSDDPKTPDYRLAEAYLKLIKTLYKEGFKTGNIDIPTATETAETYMKAVYEGYGKNIGSISYDSPDYDKLTHLQKNVYQFSGAKNWQMMRDLTDLLHKNTTNGIPPTFKEWNREAQQLLGSDYEGRWKKIEYNTAITGGQMASKAVDYNKHPQGLVQYRATDDQRECPICKPFNNIIRPWDDSFWRIATPPNHFGCRCNTIRLNDGHATPEGDMPNYETIPRQFRTNLAETGMIFPKDSPYFIGLPPELKDIELKMQRPLITAYAKKHLANKTFDSPLGKVKINMTGVDKILSQSHKDAFFRNNSLYKLQDMLTDAKLIHSGPDNQGKVPMVHYLEVRVAGHKSYMMIKQSNNGDKNIYTIQDNNKDIKTKNG